MLTVRWYLRGLLVGALILLVVVASGVFILRSILIGDPPPLRIPRETTYLVDVQPDGTLPYLRTFIGTPAIAVRPDDNAAALLSRLQVVNPLSRELLAGAELQFFSVSELLDILYAEGSPSRFDLNSSSEFEIEEQLDSAATNPWRSEEFPLIEEWLLRNSSVLELGMRVSQCSQHTVSPPRSEELILSWNDPQLIKYVQLTKLFACRAHKRMAIGQWADALSDCEACHDFSRLADQSPGILSHLLSIRLESQALRIDQSLAKSAQGNADRLLQLQASLNARVPLPGVARVLDQHERLAFLQAIYRLSKYSQSDEIKQLIDESNGVREACLPGTDWNVVMESWNREIDALVKAVGEPDFVVQHAQITAQLRELETRIQNEKNTSFRSLIGVAPLSSRSADRLCWLVLPAAADTAYPTFAIASRQMKTDVLVALYLFHARSGHWPDSIAELVPEYLPRVPVDPNTQTPPEYKTDGTSFRLHVPWLSNEGKLVEEE